MDRRTFGKNLSMIGLASLLPSSLRSAMPIASPHSESAAANLPPVSFNHRSYLIDGQPIYLHSGEFHYFRVPKSDWRRRMELFKQAGGNCIATYVPWLLHEPQEGKFVFGGEEGVTDLEGYLAVAREVGLYVIARPGPYQYSELIYDGLPRWLVENYPEIRAHNYEGKAFRTSSVSYLHPLFIAKVRTWFAQVCPILARHTVAQGGPIAFVQLDNEMTGIHVWFGGLDYNAETMGFGRTDGRYTRFLRTRYGDVGAVNESYKTGFASLEAVRPPSPSGPPASAEIRRRKDYWDFYLSTIAEYAQTLAGMIREHGIDVPLVHNSASPEMNADFLETVAALGPSFLLGSDHYYNLDQNWPQNNPTPQYALRVFYSLEMLRLMGFPSTVFELPGGSASDWPPATPEDLKACYWANLALGMKGSNYYIFTGGPNPPGAGVTTDLYDYGAAIGARGEVRPLYSVQKDFGLFLKERPWLVESEREHDCRLALDFEYARSDRYWPERGEFLVSNTDARDFFRRGALTTAFCASLSPILSDLRADDWTRDLKTPLVVVSSASMAASYQRKLVAFLQAGGRVLIAPVLPTLDENLNPCSVLKDFLGSPSISKCRQEYVRVTVAGVVNILNNGEVFFTEQAPPGAEIVGRDELTGSVIAWSRKTDTGGEAVFLGFRWLEAMREHERMLKALLERLGLNQKVECSNPNVWTSLRTHGPKSALFILNLLSAPMEARIRCRPGSQKAWLDTGTHNLPPMTVKYIEVA